MPPNQNLHFFDPARWFIGLNPGWFLIEVVGRSILIYIALQVILRLMGRRMASQMTTSELAVIVTLGAAIGVPMQVPDRGMLAGILILLLALGFQRGLGLWTFRSQRVEQITMGDVVTVVEDGRLLFDKLRELVISRERLFSILRAKGIEQLGEIRRVYVEVTGDFSIYKFPEPRPGLSIFPIGDRPMHEALEICENHFVCAQCGGVIRADRQPGGTCEHCGRNEWQPAVTKLESE